MGAPERNTYAAKDVKRDKQLNARLPAALKDELRSRARAIDMHTSVLGMAAVAMYLDSDISDFDPPDFPAMHMSVSALSFRLDRTLDGKIRRIAANRNIGLGALITEGIYWYLYHGPGRLE